MKCQKIKRQISATCLLLYFLLAGNFFLHADSSYAQSTFLSLELSDVPISEVFASVEKNSEYVFFYSDLVRSELTYTRRETPSKNRRLPAYLQVRLLKAYRQAKRKFHHIPIGEG